MGVGEEEVTLCLHAYLLAYRLASDNQLPAHICETVARLAFETQWAFLQRDWHWLVNAKPGSVKH